MINNQHYLYRMTVLIAVGLLAPVVGSDTVCNTMLPAVVGCSKDRVPNIRFNVAKLMEKVAPIVDGTVVQQTIRPCLLDLADDQDADVRFFAKRALTVCESQLSI
mmetsp:Transcript_15064/g.35892  ORF Transcript_15064/g.35892 Transcript_15064/m.35892 type:complete len:105 (-) Transcript_15064:1139-1453(-)